MKTHRPPSALVPRFFAALAAVLLTAPLLSSSLRAQAPEPYDLVIANGMVLDGTGNPFVVADVAIRDGRIAAVGRVDRTGAVRVVDATGFYVTPGFIDMHAHSANGNDGMILDPEGRTGHNSVTQGITTEAVNPPWPLAEKLERFRAGEHALNLIVSVNHNDVRETAMGRANQPPTAAELEQMRGMIRQAFAEGARYLFVNLENGMPNRFATTDELVELAKVVAELGGYYDTHQRSEGISPIWYYPSGRDHRPESDGPVVDGVEAVRETVEIAERSGARVVGHHVKVKGPNFWGASGAYVELMQRARSRGVQVYFSIYGYDSYGNQPSVRVVPPWALADPAVDSRMLRYVQDAYANAKANFQRVLDTPELRRDLVTDIEYQFTKAGGPDRRVPSRSSRIRLNGPGRESPGGVGPTAAGSAHSCRPGLQELPRRTRRARGTSRYQAPSPDRARRPTRARPVGHASCATPTRVRRATFLRTLRSGIQEAPTSKGGSGTDPRGGRRALE